ncbi:hypothetical protein EW146_g5060 [Bondarzewia mesenterica]|uniref:RING-type E3 ubiquitin transferase n=1 Tax=Bondarzewia mesenterica TaxID=1095465 RepID=A0A4S4LT86_9AGAM|nr:hypothetical protein EW146_g5060 [Bondarzewia mesenterica]
MASDPSARPLKRIKLEEDSPIENIVDEGDNVEGEMDEDHCAICLQPVIDRTVIPICSHEFCFECLMVWTEQSRRCPLCSQTIGEYVIHHIRSNYDYQKHYLPPLRTSPRPLVPQSGRRAIHANSNRRAPRRERQWGRREREAREEADALERAISRRRWIYHHNLYAKHVASNSITRYRPYPTPQQFASSPDLISRTTIFLRRELQVWPSLDVEFLTTFVLSLMKSIDIRSESAVKLLAEFLDMDAPYVDGERHVNAEHFAHEIYSYLRSPYRDLAMYDSVVQYDNPSNIPSPSHAERSRRWRRSSRSGSRSRSSSPSSSRRHPIFSSRPRHPSSDREDRSECHYRPARRRSHDQRAQSMREFPRTSDSARGSPERRSHSRDNYRVEDYRQPSQRLLTDDPNNKGKRPIRVTTERHPMVGLSDNQRVINDIVARETRMGDGKEAEDNRRQPVIEEPDIEDQDTSDHGRRPISLDNRDSVINGTDSGELPNNPLHSPKQSLLDDEAAPEAMRVSTKPRRTPRTLLQSVHAHLGPSLTGPRQTVKHPGPSDVVELSMTVGDIKNAGGTTSSFVDAVSSSTPSRISEGLSSKITPSPGCDVIKSHDSDTSSRPVIRLSAPEIMARTRARLAKMKNHSAVVDPPRDDGNVRSSVTQQRNEHRELGSQADGTPRGLSEGQLLSRLTLNEASSGYDDDISTDRDFARVLLTAPIGSSLRTPPRETHFSPLTTPTYSPRTPPTSGAVLNLRTRLLDKLASERRLTHHPSNTMVEEDEQSGQNTAATPSISGKRSISPVSMTEAPSPDSALAERRLRVQAQLRVRLVAARRAVARHESSGPPCDDRSDACSDTGDDMRLGASVAGESEQEDLLRSQLRGRRK